MSFTGNAGVQGGTAGIGLRLNHNADGTYAVRADQAKYESLNSNMGNRPHIIKMNAVWELPKVADDSSAKKALGYVVNNWQLSGVLTAGSGSPYDAAFTYQSNGAAINLTGSETLNAALRGLAEAESDGIIQVSTGGAEFLSGTRLKDMVTGAVAFAEFAHVVAAKYPVTVALHTDHCQKEKLDSFVRPLIAISQDRMDRGENPLFQSHMWDGSAVPLEENLQIAAELLELCNKARIILEVEIGVVGGEEDGVAHEINEKLYTSAGDFERTVEALGAGDRGRYLLAATFGNVHGVYKPGNVKLRPDVLETGQRVAARKLGLPDGSKPFDLVFHGGSGSLLEEIHEALSYGVVKMNVDTDMQYAFSRAIADHMFKNYDGVLKVDGDVGSKKAYDPRTYLKLAEGSMAARVTRAAEDLRSAGRMLGSAGGR